MLYNRYLAYFCTVWCFSLRSVLKYHLSRTATHYFPNVAHSFDSFILLPYLLLGQSCVYRSLCWQLACPCVWGSPWRVTDILMFVGLISLS